jgi:2'-5' RNA ligase
MFPRKMTVKKYFIAIVIPEPLFTEIEAIKQDLFDEHGLKGALRSPAHITLHRPFEWKEEKENALMERLTAFKFGKELSVELKDFASFEPRVIYVDVVKNDLLENLHKDLKTFAQKELKLLNEVNDLRGFHPHVTIAFRDLKKPKFYELKAVFNPRKINGHFTCSHFYLLKLEKKWEILKEFSL